MPPSHARAQRAWYGAIITGVVLAVADALGVLGRLSVATFPLLASTTLASTVLGVRWHRPRRPWPWWLITASLGLFVVGGAARSAMHTMGDLTATRSLLPDLITVPGYVVGAAGLLGLARRRRRPDQGGLDAMLDGVVPALAALTLAWVYLIGPTLLRYRAPVRVRLALVCYPTLSVFLVAVTASIAFSPFARRAPAYRMLLAAMGSMLVGDVVYMLLETRLVSLPGNLVDLPYALGFVAFSANVLHPSMRGLCEPLASDEVVPTRGRLASVVVALAVPALVVLDGRPARLGDRAMLAAIMLTLTGAVGLRVFRALRDHAESEAQLVHQATHDPLTLLPNRVIVRDVLDRALLASARRETHTALVFIDVDQFKLVNDTLGHTRGDELLVAIAARLVHNCRPGDLVARVGGDEFIVVMPDIGGMDSAVAQAERMRCCLGVPFSLGGQEIFAGASIGVAVAEGGATGTDVETMISDADTAMYQAKAGGRNAVAVFDVVLRERAADRLALDRDLRHALDRNELSLAYQPIVHLPGGPVLGLEALLRWEHPVRGQVPPSVFIPIAEQSDLILEIGRWVLAEACRNVARWRLELGSAPRSGLYVSVNVSARQLSDDALHATVLDALVEHGLPGQALCLELTESLLIDNPDVAARRLAALRSLNVRLSIDDFGTGYSSLAYLKRFPVDHVKIDRSFIEGLADDTTDVTLVAAIVAMARALSLTTVAEGIEEPAQERRLVELGCDRGQGYLYSRPVPPERVPGLIAGSAQAPIRLPVGER